MDTLSGVRRVLIIDGDGEEVAAAAGPVTLTDQSIENATGASEPIVAASTTRRSLEIINISTTSWTINPLGGVAAAGVTPCFTLEPGDSWSPNPAPGNAITGIGTAAAKLTVLEG